MNTLTGVILVELIIGKGRMCFCLEQKHVTEYRARHVSGIATPKCMAAGVAAAHFSGYLNT